MVELAPVEVKALRKLLRSSINPEPSRKDKETIVNIFADVFQFKYTANTNDVDKRFHLLLMLISTCHLRHFNLNATQNVEEEGERNLANSFIENPPLKLVKLLRVITQLNHLIGWAKIPRESLSLVESHLVWSGYKEEE